MVQICRIAKCTMADLRGLSGTFNKSILARSDQTLLTVASQETSGSAKKIKVHWCHKGLNNQAGGALYVPRRDMKARPFM